ncbi:MAG: hypothetical protein GY777_00995 [Candidatus Brocadiaceae bacterium]|nr:hypothetical protein [Candidatus Brocadiaceae bacterium]
MMRCSRCRKRIKKAYYHNGRAYGSECVNKAGGFAGRTYSVKIKDAEEENDLQGDLFCEQEDQEK